MVIKMFLTGIGQRNMQKVKKVKLPAFLPENILKNFPDETNIINNH